MGEDYFRYIAIDPSGSGTTGVFFWDSESGEEWSTSFKSKNWKDHFIFLKILCEESNVDFIIYETTNFIKIRGSDLTSLFKVFGAIESIPYIVKSVRYCETVFVRDVKVLQKKIKEKNILIKNVFFQSGRGGGWFINSVKTDIHEVDSFLVLYCYLKKNNYNINFE